MNTMLHESEKLHCVSYLLRCGGPKGVAVLECEVAFGFPGEEAEEAGVARGEGNAAQGVRHQNSLQ